MCSGPGLFTFSGGLVGAAGGYLGVRSQRAAQQDQLALDRARHEADLDHHGDEERDAARERRRLLYLKYLDAAEAVRHATAVKQLTPEEFAERWAWFVKVDNELELGAADPVLKASFDAYSGISDIAQEYTNVLSNPSRTWPDDALDWISTEEASYDQASAALVKTMRDDVRDTDLRRAIRTDKLG